MNHIKNMSPIAWGFCIGFIALIYFFSVIDVYHKHFFTTGTTVVIYNMARVCFIIYLMWLFYAVGDWVLTRTTKPYYNTSITNESILLGLFTGIGVWQIILFILGFVGLYTRPLMVGMSIIVFVMSLSKLNECIHKIIQPKHPWYWPGITVMVCAISLFLITKGLYPAGGHDYYLHYFHFYRKVIDSGSILPNEVWYHFYYSKGAGLFFLAMLLTDPLAPQLVTTAMIFGGAMIVYSFLNRAASWQLFPWIGASLYIIAFIYTPGPMENMRQGGWGDLEKLHEPAAIMMLSIIWIVSRLATTTQWRMWGIALSFSIAAMIIFSPTMIVFTGAYLSLVFIYFLITKNKPSALWIGKGILVAGAVYTLISVMSYFLTGLPDDQTILQFWPWVNFKKISAWGVPFEVLFLHWSRIGMAANSVPMTQDLIYKILAYIRLDVWGILFILSISCVAFRVIWGAIHKKMTMKFDKSSLYACGGFLFVVIIIAIFIGRDQSISFYRMSTFTYAPMLCVCLLLLDAALKNRILFSIVVLTALILPFNLQRLNSNATSSLQVPLKIIEGYYDVDTMKPIIENGKKFVGGQYSIAQAYKNQQGWPGRMPWGGIYPAAETVWKQLPLKTRIWSMHIHSYCMLPDCHMESYSSFRFTQQPLIVYFGEPAIAKEILKKEGLNYFFFAKTLQLTDPLPRSELFSPQHIADYLGIYWTDGDNTLLTWKEQSKTPLDAAWVRNYASQIKDSAQIASFPSQEIRLALNKYEEISGHAPPDVPWDTKARR